MIYKFENTKPPQLYENHLNLGGKNKNGDEITLNSKYIIRNGKPFIPIMGELHFSRLDRSQWETELLKMKAGGVTLISTYIFWIYHEETEGEYNFEGDNDIRAFVELCKKCELEVVLRIGPWAHGECRNGGFPDWLLKKPFDLRKNDPEYLELVEKWYAKLYEQVDGLLFKDNGNIIVIQIENELTEQGEHLLELKKIAKRVGLDVPIYTVTGWNSIYGAEIPKYEVLPVFGGYCTMPWENHTAVQHPITHYFFSRIRNDAAIGADIISNNEMTREPIQYELYPFATCELGGGIQVTHLRRPVIKPVDIYALSMIKLGCGNNLPGYYMYHGGTNKIGKKSTFNESRATNYPNDYPILSYDFQAPIGEYGIIRGQYRLLKDMHLFINDFMELLAPMEAYVQRDAIEDMNDTESLRYGMREKDGQGFVFVNNYQRIKALGEHHDVVFDTGRVIFPSLNIKSGVCFILPFNLKLNGSVLNYATAQLVCCDRNTYFFKSIEGIEPKYCVDDEVYCGKNIELEKLRIITVDDGYEIYKSDGRVYITDADMYIKDGKPVVYGFERTAHFGIWNGCEFEMQTLNRQKIDYSVSFKETALDFTSPYFCELKIEGERQIKAWSVETNARSAFLEISYTGDVIQLYCGERLVADDYYYNGKWLIPSYLLENGRGIIVISELKDDLYFETPIHKGLALEEIKVRADL